ncbi:MAG: DUF1697 domain-containing protein [Anaerolineales bacterium]|nr:DUF1697 domain-containing protein [Anaerolineales bacterium]
MTRYFTFLRAINVGGHTVKMDVLRQLFESLGFSNVETFIASGNVIFEAKTADGKSLEKKIEKALKEALGLRSRHLCPNGRRIYSNRCIQTLPAIPAGFSSRSQYRLPGRHPRGRHKTKADFIENRY